MHSPLIPKGKADIFLAMELLEKRLNIFLEGVDIATSDLRDRYFYLDKALFGDKDVSSDLSGFIRDVILAEKDGIDFSLEPDLNKVYFYPCRK